MDQFFDQSDAAPALEPLSAGTAVGRYVLTRLISRKPESNRYLGHTAAKPEQTCQVIEYPAGAASPIATLAKLRLEHPALLAPCEAFTLGERAYAVIPGSPNAQPAGSLTAFEALQQIITVGEALAYLHSRGVAHLHVQPANILLMDGKAYLGGLEDAQVLHTSGDDARLLFERDANFLALTLGVLVATDQTNTNPLEQAIDKIREHGISHNYQSAAQVIADCQQALASVERASLPGGQPPALTFSVRSGHATSIGHIRQNNEDALADFLMTIIDGQGHTRLVGCFVVADGMGGEERGEIASQIAAQSILEAVTRRLALPLLQGSEGEASKWLGTTTVLEREQQMREALLEGFHRANRQIRALVHAQGKAMGTTATALLIFGGQALIAHIGDSRTYRLNSGVLSVLTQDHSYVQRLIQLGQLDPDDPASQRRRNALYRALGQQDDLEVDLVACPLEAGDRLLLCSDGIWDAVSEQTLIQLLANQEHATIPEALAAQLVTLADEAGGQDNSTAIVVEINGGQPLTARSARSR
jgi:protein phosphatase